MVEAIAWNLISGPSTSQKWSAFQTFSTPQAGIAAGPEALAQAGNWSKKALNRALKGWPTLLERAQREAKKIEKLGFNGIWPGHPEYPQSLTHIPDPPLFLYVSGKLNLQSPKLALVGSRRASTYGKQVTGLLAELSVDAGFEVVSGGARGIDARAHRACISSGGRTYAVLAGGLDQPYPRNHAGLFEKIQRNGALISESPLGSAPLGWTFLKRNRIISGLAEGVVVIEAAARSGAVSTAHHALEQGREVFAVPGSIFSESSLGCHRLIRDGAQILAETSDLFHSEGAQNTRQSDAPDEDSPLMRMTDDESALYKVMCTEEPRHLDEIADRVSFGVSRLQVALYGLIDGGLVEELTGRYYIRRPRR